MFGLYILKHYKKLNRSDITQCDGRKILRLGIYGITFYLSSFQNFKLNWHTSGHNWHKKFLQQQADNHLVSKRLLKPFFPRRTQFCSPAFRRGAILAQGWAAPIWFCHSCAFVSPLSLSWFQYYQARLWFEYLHHFSNFLGFFENTFLMSLRSGVGFLPELGFSSSPLGPNPLASQTLSLATEQKTWCCVFSISPGQELISCRQRSERTSCHGACWWSRTGQQRSKEDKFLNILHKIKIAAKYLLELMLEQSPSEWNRWKLQ